MKGIEFTIPGKPVQQGSVQAFNNRATGRAMVVQGGSKEHRQRLASWRSEGRAMASEAMQGDPPHEGAVIVSVSFYYDRPSAHYGTGRNALQLKDSAPMDKTTDPDLDKLVRALLDMLTGVVIKDDRQVVGVYATKSYVYQRGKARTDVFVDFNSANRVIPAMLAS